MAKLIDTYEYTVASCYLSALINGDTSGLEDYELPQLEAFLESLPKNSTLVIDDDDEGDNFTRCDISRLMADCVTLYAHVFE